MELQATEKQDYVKKISVRCFDFGSEGENNSIKLAWGYYPEYPWSEGHKFLQFNPHFPPTHPSMSHKQYPIPNDRADITLQSHLW